MARCIADGRGAWRRLEGRAGVGSGLVDRRVAKLLEKVREAEAEGRRWEELELGGRRAIRVYVSEGAETVFLRPEEEAEFRRHLGAGPPSLEVEGLPVCRWDARQSAFVGQGEGHRLVVDVPLDPAFRDPQALASAAEVYALVLARLDRIRSEVAARLQRTAREWGTMISSEALAARLTVDTVSLHAHREGSAHLWLDDGEVFAGHAIEVWLSPTGEVRDAQLAG